MVFVRKGKGDSYINRKKAVLSEQIIVMLIQNVFNFPSCSYQSRRHHTCFLVIFANSSLKQSCLGPV